MLTVISLASNRVSSLVGIYYLFRPPLRLRAVALALRVGLTFAPLMINPAASGNPGYRAALLQRNTSGLTRCRDVSAPIPRPAAGCCSPCAVENRPNPRAGGSVSGGDDWHTGRRTCRRLRVPASPLSSRRRRRFRSTPTP